MPSHKDQAFDTLEMIIDKLQGELGRKPTTPEILTRLALVTGIYIGGAAAETADPEGFVFRAVQPITSGALDVYHELAK